MSLEVDTYLHDTSKGRVIIQDTSYIPAGGIGGGIWADNGDRALRPIRRIPLDFAQGRQGRQAKGELDGMVI